MAELLLKTLENTQNLKLVHTNGNTKLSTFSGKLNDKDLILLIKPIPINNTGMIVESLKEFNQINQTFVNSRITKFDTNIKFPCEISITWPAEPSEFNKFLKKDTQIAYETAQDYKLLESKINQNDCDWIEELFNKINNGDKSEDDLYHDDKFAFQPDIKWDKQNINNIYCLAILRDNSLRSIRDLRSKHIALLLYIHDRGLKVMIDKYGIDPQTIRVYFHYHPTYWWLHVHFSSVNYISRGTCIEHAQLLMTVVHNLEICDEYYKRVTLPHSVSIM